MRPPEQPVDNQLIAAAQPPADRGEAEVTVAEAPAEPVSDPAVTRHEKCKQCGHVQEQPGGRDGRCEQCGLFVTEVPPVDPALRWRCEFCHWHQLRVVTSCEHCGFPRGRETPR